MMILGPQEIANKKPQGINGLKQIVNGKGPVKDECYPYNLIDQAMSEIQRFKK